MTEAAFYALRDRRTVAYLHAAELAPKPLVVSWGHQAAGSAAGQILLLGLVNQLARFCPTIALVGPDAPLCVPAPLGGTSVREALQAACRMIDPYGNWDAPPSQAACYRIGIGADCGPADEYLGGDGWLAYALPVPHGIPALGGSSAIGAAMASCLGAANAFKVSLGLEQDLFSGVFSVWSYTRDAQAAQGPSIQPVDLGNVLMVGAGAVAAAFAYWLRFLPANAFWSIVDADWVALDNTNRGMLFTAFDAGWPSGIARAKAAVLASHLDNARAYEVWYDQFKANIQRPDIVLPLANERNVRHLLQATYPPLMVHATTSANWYTQLHRHRPGRDRCLACRFPATSAPPPACATAPLIRQQGQAPDAALPFLSAAAGLLLAADLLRLGTGGYEHTAGNLITLDWFGSFGRIPILHHTCDSGCMRWGEPTVRRMLNAASKWYVLDSQL